ncbi:MAG: hypothetical protein V4473_01645 [Patescibacteria group bacterium]
MREKIKEQLIKLFEKPNWKEEIDEFYSSMREEVIWVMSDFVKEKKYISQAMEIAEIFVSDPNPTIEDKTNQDLLKGEDVRYITSVRGSLCWLLNSIGATLDTTYYTRIIDLLEKLAKDPVIYVRIQATYPLAGLMQNVKAERNKDGTPFEYTKADKDRVIALAFYMLEKNRMYPPMIEVLTNVFDKMRFISEAEAMFVLKAFMYTDEKKKLFQKDKFIENVAPLLLFFAEFSPEYTPTFKNREFQGLLREVIVTASPRFKSNIVWHIWKTIETSPETYPRFKEYLPLFFEGDFQEEPLGQYEFLIEKIMLQSPEDAIKLFESEIQYIKRALPHIKSEAGGRMWFYSVENVIEKVAELKPEILPEILFVLKELYTKRSYIGDVVRIYSAYKKVPQAIQDELDLPKKINLLYEQLRHRFDNLPPL